MKLHLAIAILVTACTDFTDVARGVCGNGLLEAGEDCDSDDASCVRCAVSCSTATDCPTADYTCGVDGFCHAPGGLLAEPTAPVTFQADDLRIADIDRDGTGDVLGVSNTSIIVRHGDAAGSLLAVDSFVTPAQSGPHAFGDLDGDGTIDVTLTTPDGIVSYTSAFGTLSPVAIESPILDEEGTALNIRKLFVVSAASFQLGALIESGNTMLLVAIDPIPPGATYAVAPCIGRIGALDPTQLPLANLDIYRASPEASLNVDFVVSFTTNSGAPCVTTIHGSQAAGYTFDDVTPVGATTMVTRPVLADLDADGDLCPSLINSDGGAAGLRQWEGRMTATGCTLNPGGPGGVALPAVPNSPDSAVVIGRAPIQPAIPPLGPDALVMTSGIYGVAVGLGIGELYSSQGRELAHVAFGDLDRDGDTDIVLATASDDLDVLYRLPFALQLLRLDTASDVTSLTLGDFDGNGVNDIAYTETQADHQNMLISYGTADRPLDPVQVASFSGVSSVVPLEFPDSVDTASIADDLAVIHVDGTAGVTTMSLLHGSPQRTMLSFFDPRSDAMRVDESVNPNQAVTVLRSAVIGDFSDAASSAHRDLLAIATPTPSYNVGMRAWRVPGTVLGLDNTPNDGLVANGLAACDGTGVCVGDAEYLAWPQQPGHDVIIAVDRQQPSHAALLDPWVNDVALDKTEIPVLTQGVPIGAVVRSMYASDVDGDGQLDLVASFSTGSGDPRGSVRVCQMSGAGVPQRCDDVTAAIEAIEPTVSACVDAAPGRVAPRGPTVATQPGIDLVVLCHDGDGATSLYRVSHETGAAAATLLAHSVGIQSLRVDDVTGDGVDDVIAVQGTGGSKSLVVFAQCSSRDSETCGQTQAKEKP